MRPALEFVPMKQFHGKQILLQGAQRLYRGEFDEAALDAMAAGPGATALLADGVAVACAGLLDEREGRARSWALIGEAMPYAAWKLVIERMRGGIEQALHRGTGWAHRVWAETLYDWPDGHKLLLHLGMQYEGLARGAFGPERHAVVYARVREDVAQLPIRVRVMNQTAERCLWEDSMGDAVPWAVEQARRAARGFGGIA